MVFVKKSDGLKNIENEKAKIVFQFVLMIVASFVAGVCFLKFIDHETLQNIFSKICAHFASPFHGNAIFGEKLIRYLKLCLSDILSILLLFVFSFSFVNYFVSDLIIVYQGFSFGFNSALICAVGIEYIGIVHISSYVICRMATVMFLMIYACKMACFSLKLRNFTAIRRINLSFKDLLWVSVYTVATIGSIFIIKGIYCFIIYFF